MMPLIDKPLLYACLVVALMLSAAPASAQAVPVELKQTASGWQLLRDAKPYYVNGAGGDWHEAADGGASMMQKLAEAGGNSIRTWGVGPETGDLLDQAHELGLTVTLGLWLGHERHGFDYNDMDEVAEQFDKVRAAVVKYKDHPALLAWGVGNEMEGYEEGDNPAIWSHVEACAALIGRLDPNHPTMTVIAEIGGRKVEAIHKLCPSIDIVGINSYAGAASLPNRYTKAGGTKPYLVTEYGPAGAWETSKTSFGAPPEPSSTEKAPIYASVYKALKADTAHCLGGYAFLWGAKVEATTTWFGMFLPDGSKLAAVDVMTRAWSGKSPADLCPNIASMSIEGSYEKKPGAKVKIALEVKDPEGETLSVQWRLMRDSVTYLTGGDKVDAPPSFPDHITSSGLSGCTLTLPEEPGVYRVYAIVKDPAGNAAVANLPLSAGPAEEQGVAGSSDMTPGQKLDLPAVVYAEGGEQVPWIPAGYMGNTGAIKMDVGHVKNPKNGVSCIKVGYTAADQWAGVVWQDPINDWGDAAGGYDLRGAKALVFWARGEDGGEVVNFGFGLLGSDKKHPDSGSGELKEVRLTNEWRRYRIEIGGDVDLQRIKTGFYWTVAGSGQPIQFYLDDIKYVTQETE